MKDDPIVEEVRRNRVEMAKELGGDMEAIFEEARMRQAESGRKVVRLKPRKPSTESSAA